MVNHVYKIKFGKSSFDLNEDYDRLSEHEKQKISDLDAESFLTIRIIKIDTFVM